MIRTIGFFAFAATDWLIARAPLPRIEITVRLNRVDGMFPAYVRGDVHTDFAALEAGQAAVGKLTRAQHAIGRMRDTCDVLLGVDSLRVTVGRIGRLSVAAATECQSEEKGRDGTHGFLVS